MNNKKNILWYADGYHAGLFLRGHDLLVSLLKELLGGLQERPYWKINLEIEAYALEILADEEKALIEAMKEQVELGRIEIISGSYTQPLPWAIDGESTIRNLKTGKEIVREVLGGHEVVTYAVQEPCWSSQLPQLLSSLGFRWCALKNHFTYFGRPPTSGNSKVYWVGPDGSRIETSPSYSLFEEKAFNDSSVRGGEEFMRQCQEGGIQNPVAFFIEDIGGAKPSHVEDPPDYIRFALWREYFEATPRATEDWVIGQEDFKLALHWGMKALSGLTRACHTLQAKILTAERLSSLATIVSDIPYPESQLEHAWKILMKLQHHDPWLVPESRLGMFADHPFPWWVEKWSNECLSTCRDLVDAAVSAMVKSEVLCLPMDDSSGVKEDKAYSVVVFNPLGTARKDLAYIGSEFKGDSQEIRIIDGQGREVPSQPVEEGIAFVADVPNFGYRTYRAIVFDGSSDPARVTQGIDTATSGDILSLASPFYEIEIDSRHGGCLSRMYDRQTRREMLEVSQGYGNDFAGYFGDLERYVRASEQPARVTVIENGDVCTCVQMEGTLHTFPFISRMYLYNHTPRIDFRVEFLFGTGTWIGDAYRAGHWTDRRQSWHIDRKKLQVQFPVGLSGAGLYKDAAFEVIESRLQESFHETWDDVKMNTILNWVDISDGHAGLALFTDRTTSYGYSSDWPLSLILAWGQLEGTLCFEYSILSHEGTWKEAELPRLACVKDSPLVAGTSSGQTGHAGNEVSCLSAQPSCVLLSTAFREGDIWFLRFFNAHDRATTATVEVPVQMGTIVWCTDLTGKPINPVPVTPGGYPVGETGRLQFEMRPFGLQTICLRQKTVEEDGIPFSS